MNSGLRHMNETESNNEWAYYSYCAQRKVRRDLDLRGHTQITNVSHDNMSLMDYTLLLTSLTSIKHSIGYKHAKKCSLINIVLDTFAKKSDWTSWITHFHELSRIADPSEQPELAALEEFFFYTFGSAYVRFFLDFDLYLLHSNQVFHPLNGTKFISIHIKSTLDLSQSVHKL